MSLEKNQRHHLLSSWLREHRVGSHEELVARLALAGYQVDTQTIARDLDEIGALKVRREGTVRLVMPDSIDVDDAAEKLGHLLADWVTGMVASGNLLVLRTPPGGANLVARALDSAALPEIAGSIAGDDTIFLAIADGSSPSRVAAMLIERRAGDRPPVTADSPQ